LVVFSARRPPGRQSGHRAAGKPCWRFTANLIQSWGESESLKRGEGLDSGPRARGPGRQQHLFRTLRFGRDLKARDHGTLRPERGNAQAGRTKRGKMVRGNYSPGSGSAGLLSGKRSWGITLRKVARATYSAGKGSGRYSPGRESAEVCKRSFSAKRVLRARGFETQPKRKHALELAGNARSEHATRNEENARFGATKLARHHRRRKCCKY
jgi:hypothetical protein